MNFVQEEKGYCYNNDEDHKKEIIRETSKLPFSFSSSSSSVSSSKYKPFVPHQHQNSWLLGPFDSQAAASNFDNNNNHEEPTGDISGIMYRSIEKEYMFDKIVTPSDVGKLNRLVIPKQHAERYFPLDSSSNEKGLLLNFEDRNGKAWRFRYSYWNSSQSYVMTKGWSRFVKDKKLDAGDIVLFQRGVGDLGKDRLYIDWRRRPDIVPDPTLNQLPWGTRLYSLPQFSSIPLNYDHLQRMNYNTIHHQQQHILGSSMQYYLRPSGSQQNERGHMPMVIDSVPVKSTSAKRLRLFGVNMECPAQDDDQSSATMSSSRQAAEFANKGKSSLSFEFASKYGAN